MLVAALGTVVAYTRGLSSNSAAATGSPPQGTITAAAADIGALHDLVPANFPTIGDAQLSGSAPAPAASRPGAPQTPGELASSLAADGIPTIAWQAYQQAAESQAVMTPNCHLTWTLLAGIGRVESDHGRFRGTQIYTDGRTSPPIVGIALNGHGTTVVRDTDHGRYDNDVVYDHAVGPMQFIPSTWAHYGIDANGDGTADPSNIIDAAAAAARYLCASGLDLSTAAGELGALASYNPSKQYGLLVLSVAAQYGGAAVPSLVPTAQAPRTPIPTVNPAPPPGAQETDGRTTDVVSSLPVTTPTATSASVDTSEVSSTTPDASVEPSSSQLPEPSASDSSTTPSGSDSSTPDPSVTDSGGSTDPASSPATSTAPPPSGS